MKKRAFPYVSLLALGVGSIFGSHVLRADDLVISEFMAVNSTVLYDEDGDASDWIELMNQGLSPVDIGGWYLSDDPSDLKRWALPSISLEGGEILLVFASGKDRRSPDGELHASFRLAGSGEYLALVRPDGTVAQAFDDFPGQIPDLSYGIGQDLTIDPVTAPGGSVRAIIPADGSLGARWTGGDEPFDDSGWTEGPPGVGYATSLPGLSVRFLLAATSVGDLATAEQVARDPRLVSREGFEVAESIDYYDSGGHGRFPHDRAFPSTSGEGDVDDFVVEVTGTIHVPAAGAWTFGVNSDDGFGLDVEGHGATFRIEHPTPRGAADTFGVFDVPAAGAYSMRLIYYERGGGAELELFARRGSTGSFDATFRLVGDTASGGLAASSSLSAGGAGAGILDSIGIDVEEAMRGEASSAYVRRAFEVVDPGVHDSLALRVKYDDGFIAYLNGEEIARRNAPPGAGHDALATADRPLERATVFQNIDVSAFLPLLRTGTNILAIHGLNDSEDSDDFLIAAELAEITLEPLATGFFDRPSPGVVNSGSFLDFVADTKFDPDRGVYDAPFDVEITTATAGATIRYTIDGSEPTLTTGTEYTGPIPIETTTTLRAAAFAPEHLPTNVDTHTYVFIDHVLEQPPDPAGFPGDWNGHAVDYEMDPEIVHDPLYRDTIRADLLSLPICSIVTDVEDLFGAARGIYANPNGSGLAWERPASAELFFPDGVSIPGGGDGFQVNCALRIYGGVGRNPQFLKHTFRFLFKGSYGPTKLDYPLFAGAPSPLRSGGPTSRFDTLILRAGFNNSWHRDSAGEANRAQYLRDQFIRDTLNDMDQPNPHGIFVHLYLNGLYWGVYNVVERPSAPFCASYFGGSKDEWDVLNSSSPVDGSKDSWNRLMGLCDGDLSTPAAYAEIRETLDVPNLIDYMLANFYGGNSDWDGHNWYAGRLDVLGAGFEFFSWDAERTLEGTTGGTRIGLDSADKPSRAYAALRANEAYIVEFGDRVHRHLFHGGALTPEACAERYRSRTDEIDRAIVGESARWGDSQQEDPYTRDDEWVAERDRLMQDYFPRRTGHLLGQLRSAGLYPEIEAPRFHQHGGRIPEGFELVMSSPDGVSYYTTDGTDPRLEDGSVNPAAGVAAEATRTVLLSTGASVRVLVPPDASLGLAWTELDFVDDGWVEGSSGVGYENGSGYEDQISLDVGADMVGTRASLYVRIPFEIDDPALFSNLTLRMKYDDGFVAFLNGGTAVASRNAPSDAPAWDATAAGNQSDAAAVIFEDIELPASAVARLRPGRNILAIHGLNTSTTSSDFLIVPELVSVTAADTDGVPITTTTHVKARAFDGVRWSALEEATFVPDSELPLRVTELMYHPAPPEPGSPFDDEDFEFIELQNVGSEPISLSGVRLAGGVELDFTTGAVATLAPGGYVVAVKNLSAFSERYDTGGMALAGEYSGRLSNGGEAIALVDSLGDPVMAFTYDDEWYGETDGEGYSLVIVDATAPKESWSDRGAWRGSGRPGGSPGHEDVGPGAGGLQRPGDANQDGVVDLSDAISLLIRLFVDDSAPMPCAGGLQQGGNLTLLDHNGDAAVDIADAIDMLSYLFRDGPTPALGAGCVRIEGCPDACRF